MVLGSTGSDGLLAETLCQLISTKDLREREDEEQETTPQKKKRKRQKLKRRQDSFVGSKFRVFISGLLVYKVQWSYLLAGSSVGQLFI